MNNTELLENYSKRLGSTGKSRNLYLRYANDFLDYAHGNFERETIDKYLARLKRQKYSDGSINLIFRIVRTLFKRNEFLLKEQNIEWPYNRGEAPQIRESKIKAPALHPNKIKQMIQAVRTVGEPKEKAFLALSTTYGLRRIEMVELSQDDVKLKGKTIHIATAKHGRERTHTIPGEIVPYLALYDFDTERSESEIFALWYHLEYIIGMKHIDQVGWHSVRRTVNTLLGKKLPDITVKSFMRWKQRTSSDMSYRYSAITFVGEDEDVTEVVGEALQTDSDVFAEGVHPFLEYWK